MDGVVVMAAQPTKATAKTFLKNTPHFKYVAKDPKIYNIQQFFSLYLERCFCTTEQVIVYYS